MLLKVKTEAFSFFFLFNFLFFNEIPRQSFLVVKDKIGLDGKLTVFYIRDVSEFSSDGLRKGTPEKQSGKRNGILKGRTNSRKQKL